ncbi:MAG: phosphonopyruvate decarboxylase [Myxococcales bacterium]
MIQAEDFLEQAETRGFGLYTGVPCSYLKPFINAVLDAPDLRYVSAANEGDAVAIATGFQLGGHRAVAMFQNSGLGNAVSPLTSLNAIFEVPVLLIVTLRGEPGGPKDEPQHGLMGPITTAMLELMRIPWAWFPTETAEIGPALDRAEAEMAKGRTYALVMRKDSVAPHKLESRPERRPLASEAIAPALPTAELPTRREVLAAVQAAVRPTDVLIATTGFTGRALYALSDLPNQLYMVGSMGCASSLGLGLALARPDKRVIVLDGDGALLMRLGALTTVGYERPANLLHLALDNEVHDSTGGQGTVSHSVDFAAIAQASGYPTVRRATTADEVGAAVRAWDSGLGFLHVKTKPGEAKDLPRPSVTPPQVARRLVEWLGPPPAK